MLPNSEETVRVELALTHNGIDYLCIREQRYSKDANGNLRRPNQPVFKIAYKGKDGQREYVSDTETEIRMKEILPKELSKYFFFDGERIGNMSKEIKKGKSQEFAQAVRGLLGLSAFQAALDHINGRPPKVSVIRSYNESYDSRSDSKIAQYTREIAEYEERLQKIEERLAAIENEEAIATEKRNELEEAIKANVLSKILLSIENSKQYIKGDTFTLIDYKDAVYTGQGYTLTVEHDNRFVDYENRTWRMSQSTSYIEFLVMKTDDHKSRLVHYKDMVEALDNNDPNEDRINLTSRIIAKINIQFDSKRFAADGIKRTNALVDEVAEYDFAKAVAMPSNYCTYCRYNEICLGK